MADLTPDEFRRRAYAVVDWIADYRAGLPDLPVRPDVEPGSVRAAMPERSRAARTPRRAARRARPRRRPRLDALAAPRLLRLLPRQRLAALAAGRPALRRPRRAGDALGHLARGDRGRAGADGRAGGRAGARPRLHVRRRRAAARSRTRRPRPRSSPCSPRCTGPTRRGARRAWTAATGSTSPTRPTRRWPRPRGSPGSARGRCAPWRSRPGTRAMDPAALAAMIAEDRAAGLRPALVCATVGTTGTGAVDPVREVVDGGAGRLGARRRGVGGGRRALPRAPRTCSTALRPPTRSAPTPTSGWPRRSTPRCCGCGTAARCPTRCRSRRSTCATPRPSPARSSTTATGRCRSGAGSAR